MGEGEGWGGGEAWGHVALRLADVAVQRLRAEGREGRGAAELVALALGRGEDNAAALLRVSDKGEGSDLKAAYLVRVSVRATDRTWRWRTCACWLPWTAMTSASVATRALGDCGERMAWCVTVVAASETPRPTASTVTASLRCCRATLCTLGRVRV